MKILSLVSYNIFPAKLGGQKGIALFNEYLAKETSLICVTVKSNEPHYTNSYEVRNILSNSAFRYINLLYFFTLSKIIRKEKITHLVLEHPYYGWLGILLKWFTKVKLVVHSHNIEHTRWKSLGKWWWPVLFQYEKQTHRAADYNFFIQADDMAFAIAQFKLDANKCRAITYGIEWDSATPPEEKERCRKLLQQQYQLSPSARIFLFNGTLNYLPNQQAVDTILEKINPVLVASGIEYSIIICGKGLPDSYNQLSAYSDKHIIYAGFVDDIAVYFKGADLFLNPVVEGGGIKTKLVEAIGYNTAAVSTVNGSIGVTKEDARNMITIIADNDWLSFAGAVIDIVKQPQTTTTPHSFFQQFYWGNIARKAVSFISA